MHHGEADLIDGWLAIDTMRMRIVHYYSLHGPSKSHLILHQSVLHSFTPFSTPQNTCIPLEFAFTRTMVALNYCSEIKALAI